MKRGIVLVAVLILAPLSIFGAKRGQWAHESSSIPPDENVVWGELENGFRYALLPHDAKPDVISMRLLVEVGSLDEKESERGLAHFIEHMAFEGTTNFKPGELIAFFQRLGMSYGVDVNAFTYHDKTVYHLELPQNEADLVGQALALYRDYADGILFSADRIDNEREVILREKQARETPSARIAQESFRFFFEGTRLADRHPIGLESVIRGVSRDELVGFYKNWYRPDLMTLVVVGDFDASELEAQIDAAFSSLEETKGRTPKRKIGRLARSKPFRAGSLTVEGVERYTLEISRPWMERSRGDSWEQRRTDLLRSLATALFNERCRVLIDGMSDNFANYSRVFGIPYCQLSISSGGEFWWEAFVWMDQLLRQATAWGFTENELESLRRDWLQGSSAASSHYKSAEPRMLIDELVECVASNRVYVGHERMRERSDKWLEEFTLEEVNEAFTEVWDLKRLAYYAAGELTEPLSENLLKTRLKEERRYALLPYVPKIQGEFAYTALDKPGKVVEQRDLEEIGARAYRFENNTRLTFLHTENEKDTVRALVRVGGGMLAYQDKNPATHALAMAALFRSGFGDHEIEDVYQELRSNVSSFVFGVEDHDAFTYRGLSPTEGFDEFLKIVSEYLLDPRIDDAAFELAQSKLKQSRELEPDGMNEGYRDLYRMLYPNQPRFHAPSLNDINGVQASQIREWLEGPIREGYLEIAVVGDIEEERVVELVAETLGALPTRRDEKEDFKSVRQLKLDTVAGKRLIEYRNGKGDNAASVIVWTIQDDISFRQSAALFVLSAVLETRIRERAREEMGATYSPTVSYQTFPAYDTLRHIRADVDCLRKDADGLLDVVLEIATDLGERPISEPELRAAVAPLEESLRQAWRDNGYLLDNVLYGVQEYPAAIESALQYKRGLLSTITSEEILEVARLYLKSDDALAVAIVPAADSKLAETPDWNEKLRAGAAKRK